MFGNIMGRVTFSSVAGRPVNRWVWSWTSADQSTRCCLLEQLWCGWRSAETRRFGGTEDQSTVPHHEYEPCLTPATHSHSTSTIHIINPTALDDFDSVMEQWWWKGGNYHESVGNSHENPMGIEIYGLVSREGNESTVHTVNFINLTSLDDLRGIMELMWRKDRKSQGRI